MKTAAYVWQFTDDYVPGLPYDDTKLPINEVWVKVYAGATWMGNIYRHPAAPTSASSIASLAGTYKSQGVSFVPWCEPTGRDPENEIRRAVETLDGLKLAGVPLRLAFDVEVEGTPYFWKGNADTMRRIIDGVRAAHPTAELILVHYQYVEIEFAAIAPLFDIYSTMDYWTDFKTTPEERLAWSAAHLEHLGKPIIYGLPGNSTPEDMDRALSWVAQRGGREVIWRRGTTPQEVWDVITRHSGVPSSVPQDAPDYGKELAELRFRMERAGECLRGEFVEAGGAIDQLLGELRQTPPQTRAMAALPLTSRLRASVPRPWVVAGVGAAAVGLEAVVSALNNGTLNLPPGVIAATLVAVLPAVAKFLRKEYDDEKARE